MSEHVEGKWCADLRCSKCYSADTWQKSRIEVLERELAEAQKEAADWKEAAEIANAAIEHYQDECIKSDAYAERIAKAAGRVLDATLDCACTFKQRDSGHLVGCYVPDMKDALDELDAALAKNPNPSGQLAAEASGHFIPEASGPVGLGPCCPKCGARKENVSNPCPARCGAQTGNSQGNASEWLMRKIAAGVDDTNAAAGGGVLPLPSCLCCGKPGQPMVSLIEHPEVYVCSRCKGASDALSACNSQEEGMKVTDEMVNRFLSWKLPDEFAPDAGITFEPPSHWPTGTNLFTAEQARAMLEHVLGVGSVQEPKP